MNMQYFIADGIKILKTTMSRIVRQYAENAQQIAHLVRLNELDSANCLPLLMYGLHRVAICPVNNSDNKSLEFAFFLLARRIA